MVNNHYSMSHDPSEIIILILIRKFCENRDTCFFESSKEHYLLEVEIFCNMLNVFAVTFNQCNASLLNKKHSFLKN